MTDPDPTCTPRPGRRPRLVTLLTSLLALCLGLTACGFGGGGTTQQGDAGTRLVVGIGNEPQTFDVGRIKAGTDNYFSSNMFEQLINRDPDGNLVPGLATSWTASPDGTSYDFQLRQGVTFQNGQPFTADDVKFSFERYVDPAVGNVFAYQLASLKSVDVVSPTEVRITLSKPDGAFLNAAGYAYIVPKDYVTQVGPDGFAAKPVGTGPFSFGSYTVGQSVVLNRYDGYWGDKAGYQTVELRIMPDANARLSALQTGEINLAAQVLPQNLSQLSSNKDIAVASKSTGDNIFLLTNNKDASAPWAKPEVRKALALAIDQKSVRDQILGGLADPLSGVSPINAGYADVTLQQEPYDPAQAEQLLAQAGYANGFPMDFWAPVNGRLCCSEQVAQAIAGYWNAIGVQVNLRTVEYSQWVQMESSKSDLGGVVMGLWGDASTFDPQARLNGSLSCAGSYSHTCDPTFETKFAGLQVTTDPTQRQAAYTDLFQYIHDQTLAIYLYSDRGAFAMQNSVSWQPWLGRPYTILVNAKPSAT
jgi:peptide/nickel transport system substrate-binding protein